MYKKALSLSNYYKGQKDTMTIMGYLDETDQLDNYNPDLIFDESRKRTIRWKAKKVETIRSYRLTKFLNHWKMNANYKKSAEDQLRKYKKFEEEGIII